MTRFAKGSIIAGSVVGAVAAFIGFEYLFHGSPTRVPIPAARPIVAHRGVHQNYQKGVYDLATGCEAKHIFVPTNAYIENTVESVGAAFDAGATVVEIDARRTRDNHLVVMHDYLLDCRTDGTGKVGDHDLAYLKRLDLGYGYTADGGKSFPLRGLGVGKMVTLEEMLTAFPDKSFLIDHKDGDAASTAVLMQVFAALPPAQRARLWYWGPPETLATIQAHFPEIRRLFPLHWQVKQSFVPFLVSFGLIGIPEQYKGLVVPLPPAYLRFVWGWPYRFIGALHRQGIKLYLYVDTVEEAQRFRALPVDGFVTDYIERTGPILTSGKR